MNKHGALEAVVEVVVVQAAQLRPTVDVQIKQKTNAPAPAVSGSWARVAGVVKTVKT